MKIEDIKKAIDKGKKVLKGTPKPRPVVTVSIKEPNIHPEPGLYRDCRVERPHLKQEEGETEPQLLMGVIIPGKGEYDYRLFYKNGPQFFRLDLPRMKNFRAIGGLRAIAENPEVVNQITADLEVQENNGFYNVRILGTPEYSEDEKSKLSQLAAAFAL